LQGSHHLQDLDPLRIEALPAWSELERREIGRAPFRWVAGRESFLRRTHAIRCFLSIAEPKFRTFCAEPTQESRSDPFFGFVDEHHRSLVIARDDMLVSYGTPHAAQRLEQRIGEWVALGMPSAERYRLAIYPASAATSAGPRSWIVKRKQSQFVWSLPP
jgi:hypothetical protein